MTRRNAARAATMAGAAPVVALALALAAVSPTGANAAEPGEDDYAHLVRAIVDDHVRPAYGDLAGKAGALDERAGALCADPGEATLSAAKQAFADTVLALAALEPMRYGPIAEENRRERLAFWPDARGLALRQVRGILADQDQTALDPDALATKSVGVQGLTALELLLYGEGSEALLEPGSFRCGYAQAIAANIDHIASELNEAWTGDEGAAALFLKPGTDNPLFRDHAEAAGEMISSVADAMESVSDEKLGAILGNGPGQAKPKLAEYWRSGLTFPAIVATLESARHLVEASGVLALLPPDEAMTGNQITFELANAIRTAEKLDRPVQEVVDDPKQRDAAGYLAIATGSVEHAIADDLMTAIGLQQGFNAGDGD